MTADVELRQLINQDHHGRHEQPDDAPIALRDQRDVLDGVHANLRSSPGPSTLTTQRAQSSGCRASLPTSGRFCQQRTHLGFELGFTSIHTFSAWLGTDSDRGASVATTLASLVISRNLKSLSSAPKCCAC